MNYNHPGVSDINNPKLCTGDHILPVIYGGRTDKDNVVAACKKCNTGELNQLSVLEKIKLYLRIREIWK